MILSGILNILKSFVTFIIGLLPPFPSFDFLVEPIGFLVEIICRCNQFFSVSLFFSCIAIIFIINNIRLIWGIITWIINKIPFIN